MSKTKKRNNDRIISTSKNVNIPRKKRRKKKIHLNVTNSPNIFLKKKKNMCNNNLKITYFLQVYFFINFS